MLRFFQRPHRVQRVFWLYFPLLILITAVLSFALVAQSQKSLLDYALLYARKNSEILQASLHQAAEQIGTQFSLLSYDDTFRAIMEADSYSQLTPRQFNDFRDIVSTKSNLPTGAGISLCSKHAHYSNVFLNSQLEWMNSQMPQSRQIQTLGLYSPRGTLMGSHYLIFAANYYAQGERIGSVFITLNPVELIAPLAITNQHGLFFVLTDSSGNAVLLNDAASDKSLAELQAILQQRDSRYVTEESPLPKLDCTLYSIVDMEATMAPVRRMSMTSFGALFLLIVISLLGNIYMSRVLIQPLSSFSKYLSQLRSDRSLLTGLSTPPEPTGCTEIQDIEEQFAALLTSIKALNAEIQQKSDDLHQAELLRKDTEIRNLRSQINPHFLYNTLELIRADATAGRIDQVSAITAAMGRFYRYAIKGAPMVTLREEMEHVKAYMTIQQERFNGKITVLYNISAEAERILIPKMILQPLVENAIIHGLEPSGGGGILFVGASVQDGRLTISVRDSGIGIPPERLQELEQQLKTPPPTRNSIGIANVSQRLRLQYGSASSFRIESSLDDGTCIYLSLPAEPLA